MVVARANDDDGELIACSSAPAEAHRRTQQLCGVPHRPGPTLCTWLTILSYGADEPLLP